MDGFFRPFRSCGILPLRPGHRHEPLSARTFPPILKFKITGWNRIWTVEAVLHLLQSTHRSRIGWEKGRFSGAFFVTIEGEDDQLCARRLRDFCVEAHWRISEA